MNQSPTNGRTVDADVVDQAVQEDMGRVEKRLNQIETKLTPKEWAVRRAAELRESRTFQAFCLAITRVSVEKPGEALTKQAEERYPGKKPEDIRARNALLRKLWTDYGTLTNLQNSVNKETAEGTQRIGLQAALKLSALHTLILQDAFGRTASKAALWVEEYKTADKDEEENRQLMLKELAAYQDVSFAEKFTDSLPLGENIRIRFPTVIEEWVRGTKTLIADVFAHQAAIKIIQDKYFDGHPFLCLDAEAGLDASIKTIQDAVGTFNDYLTTRAALFKAEWDIEEKKDGIASAIPGEREGLLAINIDDIKTKAKRQGAEIVEEQVKQARLNAIRRSVFPSVQRDHTSPDFVRTNQRRRT